MRPGETTPRMMPQENGVPAKLPPLPAVPSEGAELPPGLTNPPGVENLLATIRRRWAIILLIGLTAAVLAFVAVWWFVPGRFNSSIIFALAPRAEGGEAEMINFGKRQPVILKNPVLLGELLTHSDVQELREVQDHAGDVAWLQSALTIDNPSQGVETVRVSIQGDYPEDIVVLLNALGRVYLKWQETDLAAQSTSKENALNLQLRDLDLRIAAKRREIEEQKGKLGLGDKLRVEQKMADARENRKEHSQTLSREKAEQRRYQDELDRIQQQQTNPTSIEVPNYEIEAQIRTDPDLRKQQDIITQLQGEIASIERIATPQTAGQATASKRDALKSAQARMTTMQQSMRPTLENSFRQRRLIELRREEQTIQSNLSRAKTAVATAQEAIRAVDQEINQFTLVNADPAALANLAVLTQDLERLNENYKTPAMQMDRIKQEKSAGIRVSVLLPPQVAKERTNDRKLKYGGAAALGAFVLAFLAVALLDFRVRRVNSARDIAQGLGLPVVGTLPLVPNRDARQLLVMDDSEANPEQLALREAIDGIRTVVLHAGRQQPLHVLLVASALNGEGKTTLASQLATSLARGGRRTLLVDCDLRDPSCHELFNRGVAPGVCEVLRGDVPVEDAIQTTEQAQLFLLPAGNVNAKALQALAQDVPQTLFGVLRQHFDYIVVDTSPILPVSDALQIAEHVDGVLMAIMEQSSQLPAIHQAQQKLATLGVRVLGAVVGGTQQGVYLYGSRSRANAK